MAKKSVKNTVNSEVAGATETTNTAVPSANSAKWNLVVGRFAKDINKDLKAVSDQLSVLVGDPSDSALDLVLNPNLVKDEDLTQICTALSVPLAIARNAIANLRGVATKPQAHNNAPNAQVQNLASAQSNYLSLIADIPMGDSFIKAMSMTTRLKVDELSIIALTKAYVANIHGIFDVMKKIHEKGEANLRRLRTPAPASLIKLMQALTKKQYSAIFSALDVDVTASMINEENRLMLLKGFQDTTLPFVQKFVNTSMKAWVEDYNQNSLNLGNLVKAISGGGLVDQTTETDSLRMEASAINDILNSNFAVYGLYCAGALAYEAHKVKELLQDPQYMTLLGAQSQEDMLSMIGSNVSDGDVMLETRLCQLLIGLKRLADPSFADVTPESIVTLYRNSMKIDFNHLRQIRSTSVDVNTKNVNRY